MTERQVFRGRCPADDPAGAPNPELSLAHPSPAHPSPAHPDPDSPEVTV